MSDAAQPAPEGKRPHPLLVAFAVAPAFLAVGIFIFVARYQLAHDEATCPFHEVRRERAAGATVREDARRCIDEVEEHRWVVLRDGLDELELGRYPLERAQIDRGFPWEARAEDGRVVVEIQIEGRGELVLREPRPDGGFR